MDIMTVGLLVGALFILIGIVGGGLSVREIQIPRVPQWTRAACVVAGLLFIGLPFVYDNDGGDTAVLPATETPVTPPPGEQFQINIQSPRDTEVTPDIRDESLRITLEGTLSGPVPPGALWIVIQDEDLDLYLQGQFLPGSERGWTAPLTLGPTWCGREARISIIKTAEDLGLVGIGESLNLPSDAETLASTFFTIADVCG